MTKATQPTVLVFDSGVGGLSVYQEIQSLLPSLNYIYLFDNEAYPYGELPKQTLIDRVTRLITQLVKEQGVDIVVIACNTASTIVLPHLRAILDIPVVGVVPAIKPASVIASKAVGLIATPATVTREYTHDLIRDFANGKSVELLGSTRLVDMAEEKLRGKAVDIDELKHVLTPIFNKIDVAVLGCTHFPLIKEEIQMVLPEVTLVDSGKAIARRVQELLGEAGKKEETKEGRRLILSSASPWEEDALNSAVTKLGFSAIQLHPLQGV